jgi:hypothetical protein
MLQAIFAKHGVFSYFLYQPLLRDRVDLFYALLAYPRKVSDCREANWTIFIFHQSGFHANPKGKFRAKGVYLRSSLHRAFLDMGAEAHHL